MKSRIVTWLVLLGGLALAGTGLGPLERPLWRALRSQQPALGAESAAAAAGQGVTFALLGGFRAIAADFLWLRVHVIWETHDLPTTATLLRLTTALDPRPLYFWLNGARILAYDMTAWRIAAAGGYDATTSEVQRRIAAEQARLALRHLDGAAVSHPASAEIWVERAGIELNKLGDLAAAATSYRRAWEQPGGPYYAARLHAEMLRRLGRQAEALAWLEQLYPQLPAGDEAAGAELVRARILELRRELAGAPAHKP